MANKHGEDEEIALFKKKKTPKHASGANTHNTHVHMQGRGGGGSFPPRRSDMIFADSSFMNIASL